MFSRLGLGLHSRRLWAKNFCQSSQRSLSLSLDNINPSVLKTEYAVRGPIVIRANEIQNELANGNPNNLPFNKVIMCNIGNPQELGQMPLTFNRQVLSACFNPDLLNANIYPSDVISRAKYILDNTPSGTVGCYTHSQGWINIRKNVSNYITKRDNTIESNPNNIFLTDGASPGIKYVLQCLIRGPQDGILIPIPQYPLYSASIALLNGSQIGYYLDESNNWAFQIEEANKQLQNCKKNGITPRAIVIINPGNPTGQCLQPSDIEECINLAYKENLMILADEVYQENIYQPNTSPFYSFRKVLTSMDQKIANNVQLVSFHSVSKGILGECGLRGGYMELFNFHPDIQNQLYKLVSVNLCPNTAGQIMVDLMTNRPSQGDPSFELYHKEFTAQYDSLQRRAALLGNRLDKINNMSCQTVLGAMYAFPSITLSQKAIQVAQSKNLAPDAFYCMTLLEKAGLCVVPGSGFGQVDGTFHFRTTLLPPENEIEQVCDRLEEFHEWFSNEY